MNNEISLRGMKRVEFEEAARFSFEHYINELAQSSGDSVDETREKIVSASWAQNDQDLWFNILLDDLKIGYLWIESKTDRSEAFICDVHIFREFRGKGYGRRSILKTKELLLDIGASTVGLCVFRANSAARSLYISMGFKDKSFSEISNRYEMFLEL